MYQLVITLPDGSRREQRVARSDWLAAVVDAMERFPLASRIAATRIATTGQPDPAPTTATGSPA